MPQPAISPEWEIPKLRTSFSFEDDKLWESTTTDQDSEVFDVKFYPYNPAGATPVFAAVSGKHIFVCRLSASSQQDPNPCEVFLVIRDDDKDALNCSCTWAVNPADEKPLICIAGNDAKVKVYELPEGKLVHTLVAHGGGINDLTTSPANPQLIASASDDTTIRIWSLDPVHARQPCVYLLGGEGHSWNLLSVAFHGSGRYVLSAGHDQVVNLWTLPDLPKQHVDVPIVIHYPHFSTSEIHTGLIDCVSFYGDHILSRACHEDMIVLWRIEGFSSADPPPPPDVAPTAYDPSKLTRSAFSPPTAASGQSQYTRLLQFHTPGCGPQFFMRFSVYQAAHHHPILAFCNAVSKMFFWDLRRLDAYHDFITAAARLGPTARLADLRPPWLRPIAHRKKAGEPPLGKRRGDRDRDRDASDRDSAAAVAATASVAAPVAGGSDGGGGGGGGGPDRDRIELLGSCFSPETIDDWEKKYNGSEPTALVKAHKTEVTKGVSVVGRQVAWSPEGDWCVIVGSNCRIIITQRWAKGENLAPAEEDAE